MKKSLLIFFCFFGLGVLISIIFLNKPSEFDKIICKESSYWEARFVSEYESWESKNFGTFPDSRWPEIQGYLEKIMLLKQAGGCDKFPWNSVN